MSDNFPLCKLFRGFSIPIISGFVWLIRIGQTYQRFLRWVIFSSFGWLSEYPTLRPFAREPGFFFLKVCFWPQKCSFTALFCANFKRFIYYIKMFLWPDHHSDVKYREQLPWLWNKIKPLYPQVNGEGLYVLLSGSLFFGADRTLILVNIVSKLKRNLLI